MTSKALLENLSSIPPPLKLLSDKTRVTAIIMTNRKYQNIAILDFQSVKSFFSESDKL